jgi:hypothetical protein
MIKPSTLKLAGAALGSALLLAGCANPMSQRSEHEDRVERKLLDHRLVIDSGEPAVLDTPKRRVRVHEQKTFEVTEFEVTRHYDRYTPYQPWREAYEMPLGAVAVVAGVGANVLNVVLLGRLPDSVTKDWISYGFAGLNPFMNVQSNGRSEQNLAGIDELQKDKRQENVNLPWAGQAIEIKAGRSEFELETDRNGGVQLNLLDSPISDHDLARLTAIVLHVSDADNNVRATSQLGVSPVLRAKLPEAHRLIFDDMEDDEVAQWVHRVRRLAELGLQDESTELEQSLVELTRNDPQLQREFVSALALAKVR